MATTDPSGLLGNLATQMNSMMASMERMFHMSGQMGGAGGYGLSSYQSSMPTAAQISSYVNNLSAGTNPDYTDPDTISKFKNIFGGKGMLGLVKGGAGFLASPVAMGPTAQEAYSLDTLANRYRFYAGQANYTNVRDIYGAQQGLGKIGSPTSAMDIAASMNFGASVGLMPGLARYGATATGFSGILGGAALASNLMPGIGITGGVGVMATVNRARTVNLMRMMGISVRTGTGSTMNDLPNIIKQIYGLLKNASGIVTPELISISAMSGNALDSMLTQFFGNDEEARGTVISGLLQMANTGKDLGVSGTRESLAATGGTSKIANSLSARNVSELRMLQTLTPYANTGSLMANTALGKTFDLVNAGARLGYGAAETLLTGYNVYNYARGGAGGVVTAMGENLTGIAGRGLLSKVGGSGLMRAAMGIAAGGAAIAGTAGINAEVSKQYYDPSGVESKNATYAATTGPTFTGPITVNVTAPAGADGQAFGLAVKAGLISGS